MTSSDTLRIVQISDPHLSHRRPFFQHNWELLVDLLAKEAYDLVVCTGDMTITGADMEDELAFAAAQFRRIEGKVLFVPGNHDIGNSLPDVRGGKPSLRPAGAKPMSGISARTSGCATLVLPGACSA